eukprot:TRINITY_DN5836_c0_g1_i1.p1 TRINITY_DN5836_c0_g1~~TRINITY_DN5836_c0_g1_i1.p1  ORF type:complete len:577 (+),score=220.81 TRINITY_DN5836_c0_g1_i1:68-1732(+)
MPDGAELLRRMREKQKRAEAKRSERPDYRQLPPKDGDQDRGYTNTSNPFGDSNLSDTFVWEKKLDRQKEEGTFDPREHSRAAELRKRQSMLSEIEKVKRRRVRQDDDRPAGDVERLRVQRGEDGLTLEEWEARGHRFEMDQLQMRADNRFRERRAKPVDVLLRTLRVLAAGRVGEEELASLGGEVREPGGLVCGLSVADLRELEPELAVFEEHDADFRAHWAALRAVCKEELAAQLSGGQRQGVHTNVRSDVNAMFAGKSLQELESSEGQIQAMAQGGVPGVDVEYWAAILQGLGVWKAKAFLNDDFEAKMKALEGVEAGAAAAAQAQVQRPALAVTMDPDSDMEDDLGELGLSPKHRPLSALTVEEKEGLVDGRSLAKSLHDARFARSSGRISAAEQETLMHSSGEKLGEGEEMFDDGVDLKTSYSWHDKYRARKPKYFNRVHTGFDWNKYNMAHYDMDNPPPKIVQGYKFNIFYPDLVDPRQQPTFQVEATDGGWRDDVCVIRFSAGPPYEDIAFKVVNKPWDCNPRRGYKCSFDRGVFHLYFSFVHYRYRR